MYVIIIYIHVFNSYYYFYILVEAMETLVDGGGGDVTESGTINGEMHDPILLDTEMEEG